MNDTDKLKERISMLMQKIKKTEESTEFTVKHKERLQKVINICKKNKSQNSEFIRGLNFLLNNYNKMIEGEEQFLRNNYEKIKEIEKISISLASACKDTANTHARLIHEIRRNIEKKFKLDERFAMSFMLLNSADSLFESSIIEGKQTDREKNNQIDSQLESKLSKATSMATYNFSKGKDELGESQNLFSSIKEKFEFSDLNDESEKFERFVEKLEKKRELEEALYDREERIRNVKSKAKVYQEKLNRFLKINYENSDNKVKETEENKELSKTEIFEELNMLLKEKTTKESSLAKLTESLLSCQLSVSSLSTKVLGSTVYSPNELPIEEFTEKLKEKLENLKANMNEADFGDLVSGKLHPKKLYNMEKSMGDDDDTINLNLDNNIRLEDTESVLRGNSIIEENSKETINS